MEKMKNKQIILFNNDFFDDMHNNVNSLYYLGQK